MSLSLDIRLFAFYRNPSFHKRKMDSKSSKAESGSNCTSSAKSTLSSISCIRPKAVVLCSTMGTGSKGSSCSLALFAKADAKMENTSFEGEHETASGVMGLPTAVPQGVSESEMVGDMRSEQVLVLVVVELWPCLVWRRRCCLN
jgi:hypothetical protein